MTAIARSGCRSSTWRRTSSTGPRKIVVNGGVDIAKKPIWIEGPQLYRIDGTYYLMCAEGGTGAVHSEVIFRAKSPWGPLEPYAGNPILTQRDLRADRPNPVTKPGHADLVQKKDGSWWAVFLGIASVQGDSYNTGRETFLLPVTWKDGWPIILRRASRFRTSLGRSRRCSRGASVAVRRRSRETSRSATNSTGKPGPEWLQIHVPKQPWFDSTRGALTIRALRRRTLDAKLNTSFLARRQQDQKFDASTAAREHRHPESPPGSPPFRTTNYWYFLGRAPDRGRARCVPRAPRGPGLRIVATERIRRCPRSICGCASARTARTTHSTTTPARDGRRCTENDDGSILSTSTAGGFVGTVLGPFARQE